MHFRLGPTYRPTIDCTLRTSSVNFLTLLFCLKFEDLFPAHGVLRMIISGTLSTTLIECHINSKTPHMYTVWTTLTFGINYSQLKSAHLLEKNRNRFGTQCFSTHRFWIKQRSSLVNPTVVTKSQVIRITRELVYIGRRRPTSWHSMKMLHRQTKIANIMHLTRD